MGATARPRMRRLFLGDFIADFVLRLTLIGAVLMSSSLVLELAFVDFTDPVFDLACITFADLIMKLCCPCSGRACRKLVAHTFN